MGRIEELVHQNEENTAMEVETEVVPAQSSTQPEQSTQQPSLQVLLPLLEQWIETGAKEGAFNLQSCYALFLSLRLLQKEPHSKIVTGKNTHTRVLAAENLNIACTAIQAKGGIFKSVEQGAQVYETVLLLKSIVAMESKSADAQDDQSHRAYSEPDLIPDTLRLKPEIELAALIKILEDTIRKGFEVGAVALDRSAAVASALRLLKQNPGDVLTTGGENPTVIMDRLKAFHVLVEATEDVALKAKLLSLNDYVLIWPIVVLMNNHFQKEKQESAGVKEEPSSIENSNATAANKKRKSTNLE